MTEEKNGFRFSYIPITLNMQDLKPSKIRLTRFQIWKINVWYYFLTLWAAIKGEL